MIAEMPNEIWVYEMSPNNHGRHGGWHEAEPENADIRTKYTRTDDRAEMQAAIVELQRALELAREQMQEFANSRMESGYVTPWTPALENADDACEQALNNTKKWSEHE